MQHRSRISKRRNVFYDASTTNSVYLVCRRTYRSRDAWCTRSRGTEVWPRLPRGCSRWGTQSTSKTPRSTGKPRTRLGHTPYFVHLRWGCSCPGIRSSCTSASSFRSLCTRRNGNETNKKGTNPRKTEKVQGIGCRDHRGGAQKPELTMETKALIHLYFYTSYLVPIIVFPRISG